MQSTRTTSAAGRCRPARVSLGLELQYISSARFTARASARGYLLTNATLFSRRLAENFEVSAGIYNLFDQRYSYPAGPNFIEETLPAQSRSFRVKVTYSF